MKRISALLLAAVLSAAPLSQAAAQDRGSRGDRDDRREQSQSRMISEAEAQSIAVRRAPRGARLVGSLGLRGGQYVFRFEQDGRIIDISVDARG